MVDQVLSGWTRPGDRTGWRDVVGRHRVPQQREDSSA